VRLLPRLEGVAARSHRGAPPRVTLFPSVTVVPILLSVWALHRTQTGQIRSVRVVKLPCVALGIGPDLLPRPFSSSEADPRHRDRPQLHHWTADQRPCRDGTGTSNKRHFICTSEQYSPSDETVLQRVHHDESCERTACPVTRLARVAPLLTGCH